MNRIALCLAALFVLLPRPAVAAEGTRHAVPIGSSPTVGPATAPVVLVEFIDYQ